MGKKRDHDIRNVSLGDSLPSPIEPNTAWGPLVAPGNTVGALKMNNFGNSFFSLIDIMVIYYGGSIIMLGP